MATRGRPLLTYKKKKIHISVDHEIYEYIKNLNNKSEFLNKAAWILMNAYKKKSPNGKPS